MKLGNQIAWCPQLYSVHYYQDMTDLWVLEQIHVMPEPALLLSLCWRQLTQVGMLLGGCSDHLGDWGLLTASRDWWRVQQAANILLTKRCLRLHALQNTYMPSRQHNHNDCNVYIHASSILRHSCAAISTACSQVEMRTTLASLR